MNAERNFLFACLIFALVIYAIHAFGLFDLLTDLPHLQTLIRQSGLFGAHHGAKKMPQHPWAMRSAM